MASTVRPFDPETSLVGPRIQLRPMRENDADALVEAAADGRLWELPFTAVPSRETVQAYAGAALALRQSATALPFVIEHVRDRRVLGSTRFWKINSLHRNLEIGGTWIAASMQRSYVKHRGQVPDAAPCL